ncbi:MAG: C40 family peptidase [Treponema sp.]|nr:C40 family peptidase [Treponema sp.]
MKTYRILITLFILFIYFSLPLFAKTTAKRQAVIDLALSCGGTPYKWGGTTREGFDCSGFVQYVYLEALGKKLPRTADEMLEVCKRIPASEKEPGDLIFFWAGGKISHVGIYCGIYTNYKRPDYFLNGKRVFISAMSSGDRKGVKIADIEAPYWKRHFYCYGRLLPPAAK